MGRTRGFTMIELMVIVAIVGILVAIGAPSLADAMARRSLEGAANELSADLHYTKSQAVSVNAPTSLVATANGYTVKSASATFKTIALNPKITLTEATVKFDPYRDFATAAANLTLTHSQTPAQLQLKVDIMGRVRMCSPGGGFQGYVAC